MRALSVERMLRLAVRLHGIHLGRPVDVLHDPADWHAVGFVILCGDGSERFLPYAAARPGEDGIAVRSALVLLAEVAFYRARTVSFRGLLGTEVGDGALRDLLLERDGTVAAVVADVDGVERRLELATEGGRAA
jgi:hypothetical protein